MKKVLMANMSSKGQIVIPNEFRKSMGLEPGMPFAIFTDGSTLMLKPVQIPDVNAFEKLLKASKKAVKSTGFKKSDIAKEIKKARNESSS